MISGIPPSLLVDVITACLVPFLCGLAMRSWGDAVAVGVTCSIFARIAATLADITPRFIEGPILSHEGAVTVVGLLLSMMVWASVGFGLRWSVLWVWRRLSSSNQTDNLHN